jgi:hypothetical protein
VERNVQDLIDNSPVKWVVDFKDEVLIEENDEYLKRYLTSSLQL